MDDREDFHPIAGDPSSSSGGGGRFHIPQPGRDLQSNWELDLAKNIEEYLLRICSGELSPCAFNFAEAALLLQGSVQVYSRKVEYLYSLVLHALDFLSQKRQDQQENSSIQPDGTRSDAVADDENEIFLGLDDVPVEAKNCLDNGNDKDDISNHFVKPPANLLVLEGDCLDTSGDTGELESYLLATCDFYRDFLLVDPCDAGAVFNFLESNAVSREQPQVHKGSSVRSKNRRSVFTSPTGRSGGSAHKSIGRHQEVNPNGTSEGNCHCEVNDNNPWSDSHFNHGYREDDMFHVEEPNVGYDRDDSDDDGEDPWKPLNPHEPGSLKIKPFKRSQSVGRQVLRVSKQNTVTSQFPIAKLEGFVSPDLAESVEVQRHLKAKQDASHSPPYFEKLRRSFSNGEQEAFDVFGGLEDENDDNEDANGHHDFDQAEFDLPNNTFDVDMEFHRGKFGDAESNFDGADTVSQDNLGSQASLEDLCRSHLDALLASIAETEKQTELAARVSTWKQRIGKTLEEQDTRPPFDIHQYGDRILEKLSMEVESGGSLSFTDVVTGQPKHDIARTFSALLQLVNNGSVDLERATSSSALVCYSAAKPFYVKLLRDERRKEMEICLSRKRVKSPSKNGYNSKGNYSASEVTSQSKSLHQNSRSSVRTVKGTVIRCTPEGKRRRRSRMTGSADLQSAT